MLFKEYILSFLFELFIFILLSILLLIILLLTIIEFDAFE
jgi:hypothetical protein